MSEEWTGERIEAARIDCWNRTDVYNGDYVIRAADFLSLLDALEEAWESERSKNAELQVASEQLARCVADRDAAQRYWERVRHPPEWI